MASSLLLSGAVMTSCESMIEEKPFDFIVPEDVEDSDNGADMWVTGVYNTLHEAMFRYSSFPRPLVSFSKGHVIVVSPPYLIKVL